MNILIPGGEGYVGKVTTSYLLKKKHFVRSLDLMLYKQDALNSNEKTKLRYEFIFGDINNKSLLEESMKGIDAVVLLAGLVGDPITKKYPKTAKIINEVGVKKVVNACLKMGVKRLISISTCSNYGLIKTNELASENHELNPLSLYAKSKVEIENYILSLRDKADFHPTILRFATAFGLSPRMRYDLTVNEFTKELFFQKPLVVYHSETWRPYCHVEDFARLISIILDAPTKKVSYEIFNVGSSENNYTKRMIVDEILKLLPNGKINYKKYKHGLDVRNYRVDFSKVNSVLNFKPNKTIPDGINELLKDLDKKTFDIIEKNKNLYGNYEIAYGKSK